ncbi:MAG TPA: hypothetical protein VFI91_14550 [Longimicrobiaceae bacterium]|nr:hypothetical protein [Longimicrobiaceae bacterium]
MIPIFLRDLALRLVLVVLAGIMFYLLEPAFHYHGPVAADLSAQLSAGGIAATLANLAGLSMLILLAGFISTDRRRGYYRIYFSHPTRPLVFYGVRWLLALALAMGAAAIFLVLGQFAAWGEFRGGLGGLWLALLSALAYGGLIAFLSAALPRADGWVAVLIFLFTYFWLQAISLGATPLTAPIRQILNFILPPQTALQDIYIAVIGSGTAWGAAAFVFGYSVFWLVVAALLLRLREWP